MNARSYKTVFSKRLGALVAVGEHATSQGKANGASGPGASGANDGAVSALAGIGYVAALSASFAFVSLAWAAPATNALPTGGTVVQGAASMSQTASQLNIQQSTQRAAINWQSFDIGAAAKVNVAQPNAQAVLLNRVVGQSPSQIFGQLQANGHVILVNPNGVLFGKDGSVNAGGFTASTLNISDANFMAGNMVYERNGSTAGIVNQGSITAAPGGYVALLGATVSNEGSIHTQGGSVVMGAGETIKVPVSGTGRIKLELTPAAINASVSNSGSIVTEGGQVYMQALALNRAAAQILQSGSIDTTGEKGGDVHVLADGGQIRVSGSITANSTGAGNKGGDIIIGRDEVTGELAATTDVSGAKLESKGGFVETSGHQLTVDGAQITAKDWLLDPDNIDITGDATEATSGYSKIKASDIATNLNSGTSVTISTTASTQVNQPGYKDTAGSGSASAVEGAGDILVNAAIVKSGSKNASLTLLADNNITVSRRIGKAANDTSSVGTLDVSMTAKGAVKLESGGNIITNGGGVTITAKSGIEQWSSVNTQGATTNLSSGNVNYTTKGGLIMLRGGGTTTAYDITLDNTNGGTVGSDKLSGANGVHINNANISATGKLSITGASSSAQGVQIQTVNSSTKVEANAIEIIGSSQAGYGVYIYEYSLNPNIASPTKIIANNDINITTTAANGVWIENKVGKITSSDRNITISSDSIKLNADIKARETVKIENKTPGVQIDIGGADVGSATATSRTLGLSNTELNKITAGNTVIGSNSAGDLKVSQSITTKSTTGNLELVSGRNILIEQALTVGDVNDWKNLNLKAVGSEVKQAISAVITANQLTIQAAQAAVSLNAAANQVNQLAANVKTLEFKNGGALQIGVGNTGITASGRIKVETTTGNLNLNQAVTSSAQNITDAVTLISDANKNAGDSDGGNIIKGIYGLISVGDGSTAKLYTGSIDGSTGMQALAGGAGSGRYRYNSDESVSGTNFSKALEAGVNVIYREAPEVTVKVNDVNKVYDGVAHSGGSFSSASTAVGLKNGDTYALVGSNAVFSGNAQGVKDVLASVGTTISALDNGKNALGYKVTYTDGKLSITPRPLTIAPGSVATKTADGTTAATVTPGALSNLVGTETLAVAATGTFSDANAGNNKAVNAFYTLQNGANGGLASNYVLALGKPGNPDTRMRANITSSINPTPNPTPFITPVNNNTVSRVRTVAGFGTSGAATGVLDDKAVTESREVCSDVFPENCECQPSVIPSIEICFAPKSVAATKEEK